MMAAQTSKVAEIAPDYKIKTLKNGGKVSGKSPQETKKVQND